MVVGLRSIHGMTPMDLCPSWIAGGGWRDVSVLMDNTAAKVIELERIIASFEAEFAHDLQENEYLHKRIDELEAYRQSNYDPSETIRLNSEVVSLNAKVAELEARLTEARPQKEYKSDDTIKMLLDQLAEDQARVKELEASLTEARALIDGASAAVELFKTGSPAQVTWQRDWLARARKVVEG